MLENHEFRVVLRADHEWVETGLRDAASILTTDVEEDGACTIPVLVTDPIALVILAVVQVVEVINLVLESQLLELANIDIGPVLGNGDASHDSSSESEASHIFIFNSDKQTNLFKFKILIQIS